MAETKEIIEIEERAYPAERSGKLDTLKCVRAEMVSVYYRAKNATGRTLQPAAAGKLVYILDRVRSCISESDLEERLARIEQKLDERRIP